MFTLGPITFHLYGFILGIAIVVGWSFAERYAKQAKVPESILNRAILAAIIGGIIGARLYHVIDYWWYYSHHLSQIFALWQGGLGIWGAVIGGAASLCLATFRSRRYWMPIIDAASCVLPLCQSIGRWGNYVNHELFGQPTNLPWKLFIPLAYRPKGLENVAFYHPLFLYESLLNLTLFLFIAWQRKRHADIGTGRYLGLYLIGYGLIRAVLEPLRINPWRIGFLTTAQWVSVFMIMFGSLLIKKSKKIETP